MSQVILEIIYNFESGLKVVRRTKLTIFFEVTNILRYSIYMR